MTGEFGPPQQGPEPEPTTPDAATPPAETLDAADKDNAKVPPTDEEKKPGRLSKLRGRTPLTIAAAIVAVGAIAATSWALARHGGGDEAPNVDRSFTFGPNAPSETATSLPTVPTETTTLPTLPTFPTTLPTSLPTTSPTTYPTFPVTTYPPATYPTYPTTYPTYPTSPTATTTSPDPTPTEVTPVAPISTSITKCGTFGEVRIVETTGVRYDLVVGDGREGRWVVRASARKGYTLSTGATTRFSGNLGQHRKCVLEIRKVAITHTGDQASDPWTVKLAPGVPKKEHRNLSVTYAFDTEVEVVNSAGDGWTCGEPGGDALNTVTCLYDGDERAGAVSVTVRALDESDAPVPPSGTVTLLANGNPVDNAGFDGAAAE